MNAKKHVRRTYRQGRFKYLFVMMAAGILAVFVFAKATKETGVVLSLVIAAATSFIMWYFLCNRKVYMEGVVSEVLKGPCIKNDDGSIEVWRQSLMTIQFRLKSTGDTYYEVCQDADARTLDIAMRLTEGAKVKFCVFEFTKDYFFVEVSKIFDAYGDEVNTHKEFYEQCVEGGEGK